MQSLMINEIIDRHERMHSQAVAVLSALSENADAQITNLVKTLCIDMEDCRTLYALRDSLAQDSA